MKCLKDRRIIIFEIKISLILLLQLSEMDYYFLFNSLQQMLLSEMVHLNDFFDSFDIIVNLVIENS